MKGCATPVAPFCEHSLPDFARAYEGSAQFGFFGVIQFCEKRDFVKEGVRAKRPLDRFGLEGGPRFGFCFIKACLALRFKVLTCGQSALVPDVFELGDAGGIGGLNITYMAWRAA